MLGPDGEMQFTDSVAAKHQVRDKCSRDRGKKFILYKLQVPCMCAPLALFVSHSHCIALCAGAKESACRAQRDAWDLHVG